MVGQLMRCYTCPAILSVLLDGKKPYRFEGIVIDSLWDVIVALCKAGKEKCDMPSCSFVCTTDNRSVMYACVMLCIVYTLGACIIL